jgi:plasmid stabilization system protein ParE
MRLAWSTLAKTELAEIRRHSIDRWGREVAQRDLADLRDAAKSAAAAPDGLRLLKGPFRIRRVRSHYLILHVDPGAGRLTVARVLHVRMDVERHLPRAVDDQA